MTTIAPTDWEAEIASLLSELSAAQSETLAMLVEKRQLLAAFDGPGLAAIAPREEQLLARLQSCLERRSHLLARAQDAGRPASSIRDLTQSLPRNERNSLARQVQQASSHARILQHHSFTNWVLVQRTLIHLSQMLEIIATGGRPLPTYGKSDTASSSGALVDQAA